MIITRPRGTGAPPRASKSHTSTALASPATVPSCCTSRPSLLLFRRTDAMVSRSRPQCRISNCRRSLRIYSYSTKASQSLTSRRTRHTSKFMQSTPGTSYMRIYYCTSRLVICSISPTSPQCPLSTTPRRSAPRRSRSRP